MKRLSTALATAALLALALAAPAQASFGLTELDLSLRNANGSAATQAGAHPYALSTSLGVNTRPEPELGFEVPDGDAKDLTIAQMPGLVGDPTAVPPCTSAEFSANECPASSQVGITDVTYQEPGHTERVPVYSLAPPPGVLLRLGFHVSPVKIPVAIEIGLAESPPYDAVAKLTNIPNVVPFYYSTTTLWGVPAAPAHDKERAGPGCSGGCSVNVAEKPFLLTPRACAGPLPTSFEADSWQDPGAWFRQAVLTTVGFGGCERLPFSPSITAKPTTKAAQSPSGLDFSLDVADEGIAKPAGLADSDIEKAVVTLPEGMSVNPSQAEGLGACSEAQLARETAFSAPGAGCPEAAKIGTLEVETPLLEDQVLKGSLYVAEPYRNPLGSLIALYIVIKDPELGIEVAQPLKVEPDPRTGQLISTAEEMPQLPFSHFRLHFREGARAPLISPPGCGTFDAQARLYPYSGGPPITSTSAFQVVSGPSNSPCPQGQAPFHPGFQAGTINNQAGSYSPFDMRLTRGDGEQDMGRFSFVLPPGIVPKLAGIPYCPEAGIAQAKSRTGAHGGTEELADPSCPAASQIGRTLAGAGVGSQLTYVPGKLYLAGPYHGDPISAVAITPALAGPFDAGVVVVREALRLNPVTHVGEVDGAASDPIPHILKGIPLNLRDLRVYADRPEFTLNATSCEPFAASSTIWGDGTALAPLGETPVGLSSRYQAAGCASLGFKPKLAIELKGGTKRGGHPALKAVVTPRAGDANFAGAVVTLPHSAFLDQAHIRTICTRVQFAAGAGNGAECPAGSVYGYARAWTPLLDQPLQGPVFLRSSSHNLPDLVLALHGLIDIDLASRIDSRKGGIRSTFEDLPDAPVSRFILEMQGAKKGLIVNSTNLCAGKHRAEARLAGQNGRVDSARPAVRAAGCAAAKRRRHGGRR